MRSFVVSIFATPPRGTSSTSMIGLAAIDVNALHQVIVSEYASENCWMLLEHWTSWVTSEAAGGTRVEEVATPPPPSVAAVLIPSGKAHTYDRMRRDIVAFFKMEEDDGACVGRASMATSVAMTPELFSMPRSMFDEVSGREKLSRATGSTVGVGNHESGAYCGAFAALLAFLEEKLQVGWLVQPNALVLRDVSSTWMTMDVIPEESLETLNVFRGTGRGSVRGRTPRRSARDFLSLFEFLSPHIITKPGKQLLKQNLKQPLLDVGTITRRQDAVAELMEVRGQLIEVQTALLEVSRTIGGVGALCKTVFETQGGGRYGMHGMDGMDGMDGVAGVDEQDGPTSGAATAAVNGTNNKVLSLTSSLIQLHEFCEGMNMLEVVTSSFTTKAIVLVHALFEKSRQSRMAVAEALAGLFEKHVVDSFTHTDTKKSPFMSKSQQIFALKSSQETRLLDIHRARYASGTEKVKELAARLRSSYPAACGGLSIKYASSRGFFFCLNTGGVPLPPESGLRCLTGRHQGIQQVTCEELNALNMRINMASNECLRITRDVLLQRLSRLLRDHLGPLVAMQDALAELDVLSGLAAFAMAQESESRLYVRPLITRHGPSLVVQEGRHPMLEHQLLGTGPDAVDGSDGVEGLYVSNDTMLADDSSTCILTGVNMAGKSVYLKQNALLVILAQIGSFVPASFMSVTPFGGISVIKGTDSTEQMHQVARTLRAIRVRKASSTPTSTVATSPGPSPPAHLVLIDEVCDIASGVSTLALSWALIEELLVSNTKAIVATHVTALGRLCDLYPNCRPLMIDAARKIRNGTVCDGGYGISVARRLGFPKSTVDAASSISASILAQVSRNVDIREYVQLPRERAVLKAASRVACLRELQERGVLDEAGVREGLDKVMKELGGY